jgi:NAD(P)-dependent dehydrogenase (short-subunit alcohol dehydrogenase family)
MDEVHEKDLADKLVVVTGANSGIGLTACAEFAKRGARVILAVRNPQRGEYAKTTLQAQTGSHQLEVAELDLASFNSIAEFASQLGAQPIDILVNNAGIMAVPYATTAEGFESQMGTNHLGHALLTAKLLPNLLKSPHPRVVTVTSFAHQGANLNKGDRSELIRDASSYSPWLVYSNSKLANLLFARYLDALAKANGWGLISIAAHPGYANTNLQYVAPSQKGGLGGAVGLAATKLMNNTIAQSAEAGALPTVMAATDATLKGGELVGPKGFMQTRGKPGVVKSSKKGNDSELGKRVMKTTEELIEIKVG